MYIRFVVGENDERSGQRMGLFTAAYALEHAGRLADYEKEWFAEAETWLNEHLKRPERFAGSRRPDAKKTAITWMKTAATEHVARMRDIARILHEKGVPVEELRTEKPGYIVYEDEHQVAAVPFQAETFARARA